MMKYTRDADREMPGSRNVVQETGVWLVGATKAAEALDTPQNGLWPKGD